MLWDHRHLESRYQYVQLFSHCRKSDQPKADFLLVITARTPSCRLLSQAIYLATDFRLLPVSPLSTSSAILNHPVEKELITIVEQGLKSGRLWFSYGLDLTNSLQRQKEQEDVGQGTGNVPLWQRADERFFWNRFLADRMIEVTESGEEDVSAKSVSRRIYSRIFGQLSRFILPVINGCKSSG